MPLSCSGCPLSLKTPNMGNPGSMVLHLDPSDERYTDAARGILRRHDLNEAEANITSAIRDFLILTNLAKSDEIVEEKAPALGARTAVDLTALDTFVEIKRRIGTTPGFDPDPDNVEQLDGYLEHSEKEDGRHRMGVLTDGIHLQFRYGTRAAEGRMGQDRVPFRLSKVARTLCDRSFLVQPLCRRTWRRLAGSREHRGLCATHMPIFRAAHPAGRR